MMKKSYNDDFSVEVEINLSLCFLNCIILWVKIKKREDIKSEVLCIQPDFKDTRLRIFLLCNSFPTSETIGNIKSYLVSNCNC